MKRRKGYAKGGSVKDPAPAYVQDPDQGNIPVVNTKGSGGAGAASGAAVQQGAQTGMMFGNLLFGSGAGAGAAAAAAAKGGMIKRTAGPKIGKDDGLIPAQKGEYVVRKSAVQKLGTKALNTINKGKLPYKAKR
jgi:hypothetical protein